MATDKIHATLTRCRHEQPLVVLDEPFNGLEVSPSDLRRLANQLTALADMAEKMNAAGRRFIPAKVSLQWRCFPSPPAPLPEGEGSEWNALK